MIRLLVYDTEHALLNYTVKTIFSQRVMGFLWVKNVMESDGISTERARARARG